MLNVCSNLLSDSLLDYWFLLVYSYSYISDISVLPKIVSNPITSLLILLMVFFGRVENFNFDKDKSIYLVIFLAMHAVCILLKKNCCRALVTCNYSPSYWGG
jgi:hypothetical protein